MNNVEAIATINEAIDALPKLRRCQAFSSEHTEFLQTTNLELRRIFGPDSGIVMSFYQISYHLEETFITDIVDAEKDHEIHKHKAYLEGLDKAEGILRSALQQLKKYAMEQLRAESKKKITGGRVFISHGTQTPALRKVERFIRSIGLDPVIVVKEASEGLAIDDLIEKRMNESDCALILATADEEIEGRKQPRPNVIREIGLAQEKFDDKVIYLKENGCEFPSNVQPKVWGSFVQDNMESAFEKISKELNAFGFI
jgi:predicted nucleotide-binding protein